MEDVKAIHRKRVLSYVKECKFAKIHLMRGQIVRIAVKALKNRKLN